MLKTYALVDVIGIKSDLKRGSADRVKAFWTAADTWSAAGGFRHIMCNIVGSHAMEAADITVVTFSDSALLFSRNQEYELPDFYRCAEAFKAAVERSAGSAYCLVSRGMEYGHHVMPALGLREIGSDLLPRYFNIAGTGAAWVNLFAAEQIVTRRKDWHGRFSVYAVGSEALCAGRHPQSQAAFDDFEGNPSQIYALA